MQLKSIASKSTIQQRVRSDGGREGATESASIRNQMQRNIAHPPAHNTAIGPPTTYIQTYIHMCACVM